MFKYIKRLLLLVYFDTACISKDQIHAFSKRSAGESFQDISRSESRLTVNQPASNAYLQGTTGRRVRNGCVPRGMGSGGEKVVHTRPITIKSSIKTPVSLPILNQTVLSRPFRLPCQQITLTSASKAWSEETVADPDSMFPFFALPISSSTSCRIFTINPIPYASS